MIQKGKIILVNGYWLPGPLGKIIRCDKPLKPYWSEQFERYAEEYFGLQEAPFTHVYLDGSDFTGLESGRRRYARGFNTLATNPFRLAQTTEGMDRLAHKFFVVTHSQGAAFGAGITDFLLKDGWTVSQVVHLSPFNSNDFKTPEGPMSYQLGFKGRFWNDWVTGNKRIGGGIHTWGVALKSELRFKTVHGFSKHHAAFTYLKELRSIDIGNAPFGSFYSVNGHRSG